MQQESAPHPSLAGSPADEITPRSLYLSRRRFLAVAGLTGAALLAGCGPFGGTREDSSSGAGPGGPPTSPGGDGTSSTGLAPGTRTDELGNPLTSEAEATGFNNFYEFSLAQDDVAEAAASYPFTPWSVEIAGLVERPRTYGMDEIYERFPDEERIYRLRCVEAWSAVIPWLGFPLARLLEEAAPTSEARFVRFQALHDPARLPNQRKDFPWPYAEGLRLDEAQHDLTLLATGLYGERLPPQSGAPLRLVVPWKYGFKSIKSITHIELVAAQPATFWNSHAPQEYGFYANVNPEVDHPRWTQAREQRLGEDKVRDTLPFNGYQEQVAHLYQGMDLRKNY